MSRTDDRTPLAMSAKFKTPRGHQDVSLSDLSANGCRIGAVYLGLSVGQKILLRPEGLELLAATVCWRWGQYAGIKFDRPLHPAVVDQLCNMHSDESRTIGMDVTA